MGGLQPRERVAGEYGLGDEKGHADHARLVSARRADYLDAARSQRQRAPVDRFPDSCEVVVLGRCELAADDDDLRVEEVDGDRDGFAKKPASVPREPDGISFSAAQEAHGVGDRCRINPQGLEVPE